MKVYIAFSIHGSNCFITASTVAGGKFCVERFLADNPEFSLAVSRRPSFVVLEEVKLHWSKLLTKAGKPYTSPIWVLRRFKELERKGWTIDKTNFVKKFCSHV